MQRGPRIPVAKKRSRSAVAVVISGLIAAPAMALRFSFAPGMAGALATAMVGPHRRTVEGNGDGLTRQAANRDAYATSDRRYVGGRQRQRAN